MRNILILALGIAIGATTCVASPQDAATTPAEPEYVRQFFTVGGDGVLKPLERATMQREDKGHNYVVSIKVQSAQVIKGSNSPVRVAPDTHFIVRMETGNQDPTTLIHLVHLTEQKEERDLMQSGISGHVFSGRKNISAPTEITVTAKKYGSHSFEVIPSEPLAPGEYAFLTGLQKADCFGVGRK